MELSLDERKELSEFYWDTDMSTKELQQHYKLSKFVRSFITPFVTDDPCPSCGEKLVYTSRTARINGSKSCQKCGHKSDHCNCPYCERVKEEKELADYQSRVDETSSEQYVRDAILKLSQMECIFLDAFLGVTQELESPTWDDICSRASVVSHESYVEKLTTVGLLYRHPNGSIERNPSLPAVMIEIQGEIRTLREQLNSVMRTWARIRNVRTVSAYDAKGIHNLVERYEPDWIKAAVHIASCYRPNDYVKYVAGILRNWEKNGPPGNIRESDLVLKAQRATDRQIEHIRELLGQWFEPKLAGRYRKESYRQLTMFDARKLIEELSEEISTSQDST